MKKKQDFKTYWSNVELNLSLSPEPIISTNVPINNNLLIRTQIWEMGEPSQAKPRHEFQPPHGEPQLLG